MRKVNIDPYDGFFDDFLNKFPENVRDEVAEFLERLQANPYSPAIQNACQMDAFEHFAYRLKCGYVIYWSITTLALSEMPKATPSITSLEGMQINLLKIVDHKAER